MWSTVKSTFSFLKSICKFTAFGLAAFPLYQYYIETEDRQADRILRKVEILINCDNLRSLQDVQNYPKGQVSSSVINTITACQILRVRP